MKVVIRRLLGEQTVDVGVLGSGKKEDAMWRVLQQYEQRGSHLFKTCVIRRFPGKG